VEPKPQPSFAPPAASPLSGARPAPAVPSIFPESALLPPKPESVSGRDLLPDRRRPLLELFPSQSGRVRDRGFSTGDASPPARFGDEAQTTLGDGLDDEPAAANDVESAPVTSDSRWIARVAPTITLAVGFVLLMLAGAGAAAWVFRDEVSRLLSQW